jgi:roadblock/LC7 domain-containing protein
LKGAAFPAAVQLAKVAAGDGFERDAELAGQSGDVPKHVAELVAKLVEALVAQLALVVSEGFLDLVCKLAGFARESQRRISEILSDVGVDGGLGRLVFVDRSTPRSYSRETFQNSTPKCRATFPSVITDATV